ncbi:MAG: ketoacyl-ACP synthase III [Clostridia bacterium]|nr:ketoacyl-ACP synthase III [Clostridia bacterium]
MHQLRIAGTGNYLPELTVTNQMLSEIVDTSDEWIMSRTGISERRLSAGEPTWHMGAQAAREALKQAGIQGSEIDLIVVTTITPDYYTPSTACVIQAEIGADRAFCFDINAACTGFVYALDLAARYLQAGDVQNILIVSSENISKLVDYSDRSTCVLFGDGASAAVCRRSHPDETSRLMSTVLGAEGRNAGCLVSRALRLDHPFLDPDHVWPDRYGHENHHYISMEGQEVFKFAVRVLADSVIEALNKAQVELTDVRYIIPHQANIRIVDAAARRMKADPQQIISRMVDFGNTSSASIPICLNELIRSGKLQRGEKVVLCGFGAGLTYGAAVFVY